MSAKRLGRWYVLAISLCVVCLPGAADEPRSRPVVVSAEAAEIHSSGMLFDGHNDLPWEIRDKGKSSFDQLDIAREQSGLHTDIPRLRRGGLKAQFWSVYVPAETAETGDALLQTMQQIEIVKAMVPQANHVLVQQAVSFVQKLRKQDLEKVPGIAETLDWVRVLCAMGQEGVPDDPEMIRACLAALLKTRSDQWQMGSEIIAKLQAESRVGIDVGVAGDLRQRA